MSADQSITTRAEQREALRQERLAREAAAPHDPRERNVSWPEVSLRKGDRVQHFDSGWTGIVSEVYRPSFEPKGWEGYQFDQGNIIKVGRVRTGDTSWNPIIVTEAELIRR